MMLKKIKVFLGVLLFASQIHAQEPAASTLDLDSAVKILTTSMPLQWRNAEAELTTTNDSDEQKAILANYQQQRLTILGPDDEKQDLAEVQLVNQWMSAVDVIHKSKKEVDIALLLPYLALSKDASVAFGHSFHGAPTLGSTRNAWPVFSAILDMPNAAQALEKFILNIKNPPLFRLDAYNILDFLDKKRVRDIANQFKHDIESEQKFVYKDVALKSIDYIEKRDTPYFDGPARFRSKSSVVR